MWLLQTSSNSALNLQPKIHANILMQLKSLTKLNRTTLYSGVMKAERCQVVTKNNDSSKHSLLISNVIIQRIHYD